MTEWKVCESCPNYAVSSDGQVKRISSGRILKYSQREGYRQIIAIVNGQRKCFTIHRLVALAFLGNRPSSQHQVAHGDGNRANNCAANLRWATAKENTADRLHHGTMHVRTWNSKLNWADIKHIRELAECGVEQRHIARQFAVEDAHISKIVRGLKWRQHSLQEVTL